MGCAKVQCSEYNAYSAVQCNGTLVHTAQCKLSAKGQYCEAIARVQQLERPSLPFENADTMLHLSYWHKDSKDNKANKEVSARKLSP